MPSAVVELLLSVPGYWVAVAVDLGCGCVLEPVYMEGTESLPVEIVLHGCKGLVLYGHVGAIVSVLTVCWLVV